jgi:hypothetical protein
MVIARFQFKPGMAEHFAWYAGQEVVEMMFNDVTEFVETCQQFEDALVDASVLMDGHVYNLEALSA